MSLIVLYFLDSTSVLSFYIDIVLTLSNSSLHIAMEIPTSRCMSLKKGFIVRI